MRRLAYPTLFALLLLAGSSAAADKADKNDPQARDRSAVQQAARSYLKAFAAGDAEKVAEHWTENGDFFSSSGRHVQGRRAIEAEFASYFSTHSGEKLKTTRKQLRFLSPDVVLISGVAELDPPPPGPPAKCTYTAILVKQNGRWLMDHVRETMTFATSSYDKLRELGWLVGRWTYGGDLPGIRSVDVTCRWSENKNYLLRKHAICTTRDHAHCGMQRIGWDPLVGAIRSWLFASDGSYETGVWSKDGDRWIIETHGFLRDGQKTAAVNIIVPLDADRFTFESTNRSVDGRPEPNIGPIEIHRQTPQKQSPPKQKSSQQKRG